MMNTIFSYYGTQKIEKAATGEKYYRAILGVNGKRRLSRAKFKRAWEAERWGRRIEAACIQRRARERAERARLNANRYGVVGG